jgi:hypothetical protein
MKRIVHWAVFLGAVWTAGADLTVVQEVTSSNPLSGPAGQEMTIMVSQGRLRIEHPQLGVLTLPDQKKNIMLMHAQRSYMVMPSMESMMGMGGADTGETASFTSPENVSWTKTGQKDQIAGYAAEQWIGKDSQTGKTLVEVWVGGKPELIKEYMDSLGNMGSGMIAGLVAQMKNSPGEGPFRYGYPLKTVAFDELGSPSSTTLVKRLDSAPVDPKWFAIPAGYQEMKMPDMGGAGGMGGLPGMGGDAAP